MIFHYLLHSGLFLLFTMVADGRREFRIAWMAPRSEHFSLSAASSVCALKLALTSDHIKRYLQNATVRVRWYDTDCNSKSALSAAVDAKDKFQPDVFLGPPCSAGMRGVAQLAAHWDIPVFGWVSNDIEFKNKTIYSTLVRVLGPLNRLTTTLDYVSFYFKWKIYAMIHDQRAPYRAAAEAIKKGDDYVITSTHEVNHNMDDKKVEEILLQVRKYARVIIFSVPWLTMRKYMLVAHKLGMSDGDFAFLCMHGDLYTYETLERDILSDKGWRRNDSNDDAARQAFESVFHITMDTIERQQFVDFRTYAMTYANHTETTWEELPNGTEPDAYAPYLYDATLTWALLVDQIIKEGTEPTSGKLLLRKATKFYSKGVTGDIVLDEMGDRLLNFGVMDMQADYTFERFLVIHHNLTENKVLSKPARWPNGKTGRENAPPDTPVCGFDGEYCVQDYTDTIVGAAAGSSFVLILAIAFNIVLRRYRRLKLLKSMIWQVRFEEIDFVTALLSGSVRASFRNLGRRRSVPRKSVLPKTTKPASANNDVGNTISKEDSPQFHKSEHGTMFGSVAYVRGALVSVKRMSKNTINVTKEVIQELNQLMELKHQNLCAFVGSCIDPGRVLLLWEYCPKGSLQDVIWNQNIKLDRMFMFALSQDIAKGLEFVHKSAVHFHGNLKSSNCVVDSRWTCKLTDFGVPRIRAMDKTSLTYNEDTLEKLLWTAPEVLRGEKIVDRQKADIFSLGIILKEIFTRSGPYTEYPFLTAVEIISKIREHVIGSGNAFRPMIGFDLKPCTDLVSLIEECWGEDPLHRPSAARVSKSLNRINPSKNLTMIDSMLAILEKYANHLEELVAERTSELDAEKKKTENLLYRMLPQSVAEDLKLGKTVKAEQFDEATIYFSDIVGFTTICADSTPIEVVNLLNSLYTLFDDIITRYDVYKVETIGDAYMLASGLPKRNGDRHTKEICDCALDILASVGTFCIPHQVGKRLRIRVGIHSGPVVAGVVGLAMPRYCLFGDTVNTASRMESTGLPLKIHLSSAARKNLENYPGYHLNCRGEINVKGKGIMQTYFLYGRDGFAKDLPKIEEDKPIDATKTISISSDMCVLRNQMSVCSDMSSISKQHSTSSDISDISKKISTSSEISHAEININCDSDNKNSSLPEPDSFDRSKMKFSISSDYNESNKIESLNENNSNNVRKNSLPNPKEGILNKAYECDVIPSRKRTSTVGDVRRIIKHMSALNEICCQNKNVSNILSDINSRVLPKTETSGVRRKSATGAISEFNPHLYFKDIGKANTVNDDIQTKHQRPSYDFGYPHRHFVSQKGEIHPANRERKRPFILSADNTLSGIEKRRTFYDDMSISGKKISACSDVSEISENTSLCSDVSAPSKKVSTCSDVSGSIPPDTPMRIDSLENEKDFESNYSNQKCVENKGVVEMTSL